MKGSLLLSLGLLLVIWAASASGTTSTASDPPENLAKETRDSSLLSSVTTRSDNKSGTFRTNSNSPLLTRTNKSSHTNNSFIVNDKTGSAVGQSQSTSGPPQTSGPTQPAGATSPASGPPQPTSGPPQTSGPTQPAGASSPASGPPQPTSGPPQTSGPTQPAGASSPASGPPQPTNGPPQTSGPTQPAGASSPASGPPQPTNGPPQTSGPTQPAGATSPASGPPQPTNGPPQTSGPTQPAGATSPASGPPQPTNGPPQTSGPTQPAGASSPASGPPQPTSGPPQTPGPTQPAGASSPMVTSSSSTGSHDPCSSDPCKGTASCVKLNSTSFCLCMEGYYYNDSSCVKGVTFPGEITMDVPDTADLDNKNSKNYQDLHSTVVSFFTKAFNETDYGQTVILKVSKTPSVSSRSVMRATSNVGVSIVNMFKEGTKENMESVNKAITDAIKKDGGSVQHYSGQDLCDYYGCVKNSNGCQDALQCTCKPGLDRVNLLVPFCVAVTCAESCKAEDKKQCLKKDNGAMECVCMPGYQKENGKCKECPFGYSGMDCKDQFQLILTIVGTIAGALILILLIAFIVFSRSKNKKKNIEEQKLIEDDFHNLRLRQTGFSNFGADNSIFPKAKIGAPSQTSNPYANQRSMPRPDY